MSRIEISVFHQPTIVPKGTAAICGPELGPEYTRKLMLVDLVTGTTRGDRLSALAEIHVHDEDDLKPGRDLEARPALFASSPFS